MPLGCIFVAVFTNWLHKDTVGPLGALRALLASGGVLAGVAAQSASRALGGLGGRAGYRFGRCHCAGKTSPFGGMPGNGLIRGYKSPKSIYLTTGVAF